MHCGAEFGEALAHLLAHLAMFGVVSGEAVAD
jgi:hypothetical protein